MVETDIDVSLANAFGYKATILPKIEVTRGCGGSGANLWNDVHVKLNDLKIVAAK
jgi:hypothetical protein